MSNPKLSATTGSDWTQLLTDPDLVSHLGKLLQIYREAPPDTRGQALLDALREIKNKPAQAEAAPDSAPAPAEVPITPPATVAPAATPPFEPDMFTPSWDQDRRRYPRMKCFVAVELRVEGSETPIWGNLANTSRGGCLVETAAPVQTKTKMEIGLWVANGKVWVKGIVVNGIVTKSSPCFGVRIKFAEMEPAEREALREFLKFVESTTRSYHSHYGYLAQMKR